MSEGLPKGWIKATLGDIFEFKYGKGLPQEKRHSKGTINVFGSNGVVGIHDTAVTKGPTIIVGRKGSVGEVHYSVERCWPIDTTYFIDNFPCNLSPKYWTQYFKSLQLGQQEKSSAIPGISRADIYPIELFLPPLNEQIRIESKLDQLLVKVEASKKRLDNFPKRLKRFRQSVLAAACTGKLTEDWREKNPEIEEFKSRLALIEKERRELLNTEINEAIKRGQKKPTLELIAQKPDFSEYDLQALPELWGWIHIGFIGRVKSGKRLPAGESLSAIDTGQPYIRAANLKEGTVKTDDILYVPEKLKYKIRNYIVKANDVYITIVGACIGDAGIIPNRMNGANLTENAAKITALIGCEPVYLSMWLRSPFAQQIIQSNIMSAAQGKLALFRIEQIPVPLPSQDEQKEIVRRIEALFAVADQLEARYKKAQTYVEKLSQSILAKAFRGELVPQDPNDEPASVLLDRIKAERDRLKANIPLKEKKSKRSNPKKVKAKRNRRVKT
jgi:type I restriction enzyme S subunit